MLIHQSSSINEELFKLFTVYTAQAKVDGIYIDIHKGGRTVSMQLNTGASLSLIPEYIYKNKLKDSRLHPTSIHLVSYTGDKSLGTKFLCWVSSRFLSHMRQQCSLPLIVVKGNKSPLLECNWLQKISLNWKEIFSLRKVTSVCVLSLSDVLEKHLEMDMARSVASKQK